MRRVDDARLVLLMSPVPAPNPSMSDRSPHSVNVVSLFMFLRDWFVREFYASRFIAVELFGERLGTVVITVFKVRVRFHVAVVLNRQSGVSNVVPVVRIVYLGEATFPNTRETYATW